MTKQIKYIAHYACFSLFYIYRNGITSIGSISAQSLIRRNSVSNRYYSTKGSSTPSVASYLILLISKLLYIKKIWTKLEYIVEQT